MKRLIGFVLVAALAGCSAADTTRTAPPLGPAPLAPGDQTPEQLLRKSDYLAHIEFTYHYATYHSAFDDKIDILRGKDSALMSGYVIEYGGRCYVVTASHIKHLGVELDEINVFFNNKKQVAERFELLGYDRRCDTAVLRPVNPNFRFTGHTARLGDYATVKENMPVVTLGSPYGFRYSLRKGEVQTLQQVIEVDGAAYPLSTMAYKTQAGPGNSGGPVLNLSGEVIAMHVASEKIEAPDRLGYAIPIDDVKSVLPDLIAGKKVD